MGKTFDKADKPKSERKFDKKNQKGGKGGKFDSKSKGGKKEKGADGIKFIAGRKKIAVDDNRKNLRRQYNRLMRQPVAEHNLKIEFNALLLFFIPLFPLPVAS